MGRCSSAELVLPPKKRVIDASHSSLLTTMLPVDDEALEQPEIRIRNLAK
jgi:hypothetical protein